MPACTIVIPTYERSAFLRRALRYYEGRGARYPIVVADSSSDEVKRENRATVESISGVDVVHLDHFAPDENPCLKVVEACRTVATPYMVLCADDDFTTPRGIDECVAFLMGNPDYSLAQGYCIVFTHEPETEGGDRVRWQQYLVTPTIDMPDPLERLYFHLSAYQVTYYAVHSTTVFIEVMQEAAEHTDDSRFGELLPSALSVVMGKCRHLDVLYSARESHPAMAGAHVPTLRDFMADGSYEGRYARFRARIVERLVSEGAEREVAGAVADSAWHNYLSPGTRADEEMAEALEGRTAAASAIALREGFSAFVSAHHDEFESELASISSALAGE